jgi:hypothetical protein
VNVVRQAHSSPRTALFYCALAIPIFNKGKANDNHNAPFFGYFAFAYQLAFRLCQ